MLRAGYASLEDVKGEKVNSTWSKETNRSTNTKIPVIYNINSALSIEINKPV